MNLRETLVIVEPNDFNAFFRAHYRSVTSLAYGLCGDMGRAEDLAQDAFVAAHRSWRQVGEYDDPGAWVRRVVANKATSLRRTRSAERRAFLRLGTRRRSTETDSEIDDDAVWAAVRALPRRQAQVVALTFLDQLDADEIARVLQCGEASVKTHLHRAKATLARRLGLDHSGEDGWAHSMIAFAARQKPYTGGLNACPFRQISMGPSAERRTVRDGAPQLSLWLQQLSSFWSPPSP
jgi:RNA polymerase sigma-70 factor (ECF subfamily)